MEEKPMSTGAATTEDQIRQRLAELKHQMYLGKREGQLLRLELRTDLLRARARQALAEGRLTQADIDGVRQAWETFKSSLASLKAAAGISTKEQRAAVTTAWNDLSGALRAARRKAGSL